MSNTPQLPLIPAGLPWPSAADIPMVDTRPDTTKADTEAARDAWKAAHDAIMLAWQLTPSHMLRTWMTIQRKQYNQGLALAAAVAMFGHANQALDKIALHERKRAAGRNDAAATDAEAVGS